MAHTFHGNGIDKRRARRDARRLREERRTRRGQRPGYGKTDFRAHPILSELQATR